MKETHRFIRYVCLVCFSHRTEINETKIDLLRSHAHNHIKCNKQLPTHPNTNHPICVRRG
ncbi:hypothetical protein RSSM_04512 [Rhodopirellula sallentina SM41]|uniref:Uncharacterized protein n=1 Tax=Rhodopirellula sallentina SM41 TaxID=1263870 RepID=M5U869_9BACT|nr:hypothetical protein RSSM_04512 [Rhodopirellula sallentina SM41]